MNKKIQRIKAKYRYSMILLRELVVSDFKLRYQNSVLGYLWSLLRPFSLFVILYFVFVKILKAGGDIPHFGVYLLIGIVVWNYFSEVTNNSVSAIVGKGDLLRKVSFPRYTLVVAGSLSALINLLFNFIVITIFMFVAKTEIHNTVIFLPLLIFELFVFSLAIGFLLSALYVRYRDMIFIWEVLMQGAFFATPIMYAFSLVSSRSNVAAHVMISNPVAQIMQDMRFSLVSTKTETLGSVFGTRLAYLIPFSIVLCTSVFAGLYFRARAPYFAEEV